jgi:hypothetical protein
VLYIEALRDRGELVEARSRRDADELQAVGVTLDDAQRAGAD